MKFLPFYCNYIVVCDNIILHKLLGKLGAKMKKFTGFLAIYHRLQLFLLTLIHRLYQQFKMEMNQKVVQTILLIMYKPIHTTLKKEFIKLNIRTKY